MKRIVTRLSPFNFIFQDRWLLGIMVLALSFGLIYNFTILLGYGPDEPRHMNYVKLLFQEHSLPYLEADGKTEHGGAHTLHPPLYYFLLLPFYGVLHGLPGEMEWHFLRLVGLLLCLGAIPFIYQIAQTAGRGSKTIARLAAAQVALLPMFGMTSGIINNDSAALFFATLFIWLLIVKYFGDRSWKSAIVLGIAFGLGGLSKASVLWFDGAALLIYLLSQEGFRFWRSFWFWKRLAVVSGIAFVIAAPWAFRNVWMGGEMTPIAAGYTNAALPSPSNGFLVMMMHDNFPPLFMQANWGLFYSLWAQKDWIPEVVRQPIYWLLLAYCGIAVYGLFRFWKVNKANFPALEERQVRGMLCVAVGSWVINWFICVAVALFVHWAWAEGGRYLLPMLSAMAVVLACGWSGVIGEKRIPALTIGWIVFAASLNLTCIYWLLAYLNPTFGPKW